MQRIYPYHFSLMFGWNGKLNLECEITSLYDSRYYWNDNKMEIDLVIAKNGLLPIEVKETDRIRSEDTGSLRYFMSRFKVKHGVLVYNGEQSVLKDGSSEITLMPSWKAFLDAGQ